MNPPAIWPKPQFKWPTICYRKGVAAFTNTVGSKSDAFGFCHVQ
jgi:hypothetical protein